jgi:3'(2'), 5'-bisphosphate nucleotidase
MKKEILKELLPEIRRIATEAGEKIMEIYEGGFDTEIKADDSPVTTADLAANTYIVEELEKLSQRYPILTEEAAETPFSEREKWETYWLVDPLDGTKEFIKRRDSFTVNIALIHQHQPVLGVVYAPAMDLSYFACQGQGSFKQQTVHSNPNAQRIYTREIPLGNTIFVGSRSHTGKAMEEFLDKFSVANGSYELLSMGSSLKMCMVAEGAADCYPRLWLTSEWDTAAAHCIVNEAGGRIVKTDMSPLLYNTKDSLLNPYFFAIGNNTLDWAGYLPKADQSSS